jgi:hypothetical protein
MALRNKSLFLYGFEINANNSSLDFRSVSLGPVKMASISFGFYTLTGLMAAIKSAMQAADPLNVYTITANRTFSGGTQNRITISTSGAYLDLLFGTGPRIASSISSVIGFAAINQTGAITYQGGASAGTGLVPDYVGYNYLSPDFMRTVFGAINISASGDKETVVFAVQKFFQAEFKYEPEVKVVAEWTPFLTWAIQQKVFEFTPDVTSPGVFYECTLESSSSDGKGLGYTMQEMLPDFPFLYKTGMLKFRQKPI